MNGTSIGWAKYFGLWALLVAPLFATEAVAQTGTWTQCATEGGVCNIPGSGQVRYGASGAYVTQSVTNSIECSNAFFGDPAPGVVKACEYLTETPPPPPTAGWTHCADENGTCNIPGTGQVRYGASGAYVTLSAANSIECSNTIFGDPAPGVAKACEYQIESPPPPPPPTAGWTYCADENGICNIPGSGHVRYGAGGAYVTLSAANSIECSNATFGDPTPGVAKSCEYQIESPPPPPPTAGWTYCADENGTCNIPGTGQVRYGASGAYVTLSAANSIECSNTIFGDPAPGVAKACEYLISAGSTPAAKLLPSDSRWSWNPRASLTFTEMVNEYQGMWAEGGFGSEQDVQLLSLHRTAGDTQVLDVDNEIRIATRIPDPNASGEFLWRLRAKDGVTPYRYNDYAARTGPNNRTQIVNDTGPGQSVLLDQPYFIVFGFRIYDFLQNGWAMLGDFHAVAPVIAPWSSRQPWGIYLDNTGYAFSTVFGASEAEAMDPALGNAFYHDTSADNTNMHYFVMKFMMSTGQGGYIHLYRRIGRHGSLVLLRSYHGPTCYQDTHFFPKFGIYAVDGVLPAELKVDYKPFMLIKDDPGRDASEPALDPTVMLNYLDNVDGR